MLHIPICTFRFHQVSMSTTCSYRYLNVSVNTYRYYIYYIYLQLSTVTYSYLLLPTADDKYYKSDEVTGSIVFSPFVFFSFLLSFSFLFFKITKTRKQQNIIFNHDKIFHNKICIYNNQFKDSLNQ